MCPTCLSSVYLLDYRSPMLIQQILINSVGLKKKRRVLYFNGCCWNVKTKHFSTKWSQNSFTSIMFFLALKKTIFIAPHRLKVQRRILHSSCPYWSAKSWICKCWGKDLKTYNFVPMRKKKIILKIASEHGLASVFAGLSGLVKCEISKAVLCFYLSYKELKEIHALYC